MNKQQKSRGVYKKLRGIFAIHENRIISLLLQIIDSAMLRFHAAGFHGAKKASILISEKKKKRIPDIEGGAR